MTFQEEQIFIAKIESANADELARLLRHPTVEQEKVLRTHLGDGRYQRMHSMALRSTASRSISDKPKGNVVVIHGIMGGELTISRLGGSGDLTWVNAFRILRGWLSRLRLNEDGREEYDSDFKVSATGIMKRYYGELILSLSENWNVRAFWFDWRKDLESAAAELEASIGRWFEGEASVHIVAHSMGGLVARTFIKNYPDRWEKMWDQAGAGKLGGRLVMLGTPNHGSFAIPQVISGIDGIVKKLALLDIRHSRAELLDTLNTFVGSYQMLPSPLVMPKAKLLYDASTYAGVNVSQRHLDRALQHHEELSTVVDVSRMIYIAGYDQPTYNGIKNWERLDSVDSYGVTGDGDGRVPHSLGMLKKDGEQVPVYYVKENHGALSENQRILGALTELLETGATNDLNARLPQSRSLQSEDELRAALRAAEQTDEELLKASKSRMGTRGVQSNGFYQSRGAQLDQIDDKRAAEQAVEDDMLYYNSPEARKVEENVTRGFLGSTDEDQFMAQDSAAIETVTIEIGLHYGPIDSEDFVDRLTEEKALSESGHAVDAISVGHYIGVKPQAAELALDRAISRHLLGMNSEEPVEESDLLLTQYTQRGIIRGELGQPFFLMDPRTKNDKDRKGSDRVIAIVGMDEPGRFGAPELTVMTRELCWALGRMGQRHLATVVIGAGNGNLDTRNAISAWLDGIRRAITGSKEDDERRLRRITFVENDPRKIRTIQTAIRDEVSNQQKKGLEIIYKGFTEENLEALKNAAADKDHDEWKKWREAGNEDQRSKAVPTRVTLKLEQKTYRFAAITDTASVPEREITIDPALVMRANDELAGESNPPLQLERGQFLEQLLMPDDLRRVLYSYAPLVMLLDATTARIHWEMVAQPGIDAATRAAQVTGGPKDAFEYEDNFLGTCRGLTRQLRTTFAPPPEPPPPPRRVLRVLIVADPAEDAHLPGAQEEGVEVAELFESFNEVYKDRSKEYRVEVKRLFGPLEATRTNVLRELMIRPYDVLHFAGHCVYQWGGDPTASGWIFNAKNKELLSASELNRIDRIPKFVFSNACESGITPERAQDRNVHLAPSFAEAFFARGVANFVCTAWPVDDIAARRFARKLYGGLLGLKERETERPDKGYQPTASITMHEAMRAARLSIASTSNGRKTWGAYQHYGDPYLKFFNLSAPDQNGNVKTAKAKSNATASKQARRTTSAKSSAAKKGATKKRKSSKK